MTTASTDRPEPVLDAAKLAAAVSGVVLAVGAALVLVGWATTDQIKSWSVIAGGAVTAIGTLLAVVMPIITALGARAQVTPLAAPQGVDGAPLVADAQPPALSSTVKGQIAASQQCAAAAYGTPAATEKSDADLAAEYDRYIKALGTDEPTEPVPAVPVDRTPQPIELEAQAAATSPSIPTASSDDTGVIPTVGQPPVPTGATAATAVS